MHYLVQTEKDDPLLVAEVRDRFSAVEEPFERLHSTVLQRQARLQNIVIQSQDFQLSLSEALDQLNEYEKTIAQLQPVSAVYEVALQQKEDHEVNYISLLFIRKIHVWKKSCLLHQGTRFCPILAFVTLVSKVILRLLWFCTTTLCD